MRTFVILRTAQRTRQGRVMDIEVYVIELIGGLRRIGYGFAKQFRDELDRLGILAASFSVRSLLPSDFSGVQKAKTRR